MAYLYRDENRLLHAYPGNTENESPSFTWSYSTFEQYLNEDVTPSMYHYMANFVAQRLTHENMNELERGEYMAGDLEEWAVDAYFEIPIRNRITMHNQELTNLEIALCREEVREEDAITATLTENKPWDHTSPIDQEYDEFMNGIVADARAKIARLREQLHEERTWFGGHEENLNV